MIKVVPKTIFFFDKLKKWETMKKKEQMTRERKKRGTQEKKTRIFIS